MAIERIQGTPKVEWTPAILAELGVAAVLAIASVLLSWSAFSNWRFKENLIEGYQDYDRGQPRAAQQALETALSWRPKHTGARELLAKILCDEGKLAESRKHYQILTGEGFSGPEAHIGLGVIALKEALAIDAPREAEAKIAEAEAEYRKAAGVPEAEIGLGHCDLLRSWKAKDPSQLAKAQVAFHKVSVAMTQSRNFRAGITRDGLMDYYAGLGKALSLGGKTDEEAIEAFRACFQYSGNAWGLPLANILALEGKRLAGFAGGADGLAKLAPAINALRNQAGAFWRNIRNSDERDEVREPWLMYSLAAAQAWGRTGNVNEMTAITHDLLASAGLEQRIDPALLDAEIRTELALREDVSASAQEAAVARASASYGDLLQRLPLDDAHKDLRGRVINDSAWALAWRGGYANNETLVMQAQQRLQEALRLVPDDYVYNRNMAVVLKRLRRPPVSPQPYLDRCRFALAKDKDWATDFAKVEKYMEEK